MISGVLPRKELVMKELESLLRVGVPKKLRFGDCTLLRMSMDCLGAVRKESVISFLLCEHKRRNTYYLQAETGTR
jgi:hypothetical protein